jgi:guanine nucleotide-binding protein G(i) subunit alpha
MGCGGNKTDATTKEIDKQLKEDKKKAKYEVKLLLLGSGESGKTTILKQMKLIHDHGFTQSERDNFKEIVYANVKTCMSNILMAMDKLEIPLESSNLQAEKAKVLEEDAATDFPAVAKLWQDGGVRKCYERSREYQLPDCAQFFFDEIERVSAQGYIPTDQDILHCRVKSTGITETKFKVGDLIYNMVDVGGQRSERRKWIHCFENVTAIIFVVAVGAFDQMLIEDESVNRMHEALTLFDSICNGKWFTKTSMILFLNKIDILMEKLKKSKLVDYFPEYDGPNEYQPVIDFFTEKFRSINQSDTKQIYVHCTCATDTDQIRFVMAAVNDIVIQKNLRNVGLL